MIYGGNVELFDINLDKLVVLPQIRKTKNPKIDEIASSIEKKGLIQFISVAKLTYEELKKHIDFINQLWKKNTDISSFESIDGYYYVVIAGHTRLKAMKKISKENDRKDQIRVSVHRVKNSEDILALQIDENLHKEVSIEERAIAIIETYHLGILSGKWNNKIDFIKQNGNVFSKEILNDALVFTNLPIEIQEYVFANNIPFTVGVELGRMIPLIKKYEADFVESEELLEKNVYKRIIIILSEMQNSKSIKRSLLKLSGYANMFKDHFRDNEVIQQEMLDWFKCGSNRQEEEYIKQLTSECDKAIQSLCDNKFEKTINFFKLDSILNGTDRTDEMEYMKKLQFVTKKI